MGFHKVIIILTNPIKHHLINLFHNSSDKTKGEGYVPFEFCHLLRMSLSRKVSTGEINAALVNLNFWKLWPEKFTSVTNYEKKLMARIFLFFFLFRLTDCLFAFFITYRKREGVHLPMMMIWLRFL